MILTREGKGKVEGRKSLIERNPEVVSLIRKYKNSSKKMNDSEISRVIESEYGIKIHRTSIPKVLKDFDLRKREERNRKRRKSSMTELV